MHGRSMVVRKPEGRQPVGATERSQFAATALAARTGRTAGEPLVSGQKRRKRMTARLRWTRLLARSALIALVLATIATLPSGLHAQDFPTRPVKIVVPFPAGGTADVMPRIVGDWLSRKWGQAVII